VTAECNLGAGGLKLKNQRRANGCRATLLERAPTRKQPEDTPAALQQTSGEVTNSPEVGEIPAQQMAMLVGSAMALSGEANV
jgi:hypothetical protein